jgi:DNA repair photolyase
MEPQVTPLQCKSALNRVRGMDFAWSLNPYRGCAHACVYCFARRTHTFFDLGAGPDFSSRLFVKVNVVEVLEAELGSPTWRREMVAVGTATDPYQPLEARWRLTRGCLEALARHRTPVTIVTKGPMVRRDVDVLQELARCAGCTVCVSVPTVDEDVWRKTEPGTPAPRHRLLAVRHLVQAGIRAGVLLAPLLPGISDDRAHIAAAVAAAAAHGACFVEANLLYLRPEVKDYYFGFLEAHYPHLLPRYAAWYAGAFAPPRVKQAALAAVQAEAARLAVGDRRAVRLEPPPRPRVLTLPGLPVD